MTQPGEKHAGRALTGGHGLPAAGLSHRGAPGGKRRWHLVDIASSSGVPGQPQPGPGAVVASLPAHPCVAQRHGKTPCSAVGVMLLYLRMAVAGAERWGWVSPGEVALPGGFLALWLSPTPSRLQSKALERTSARRDLSRDLSRNSRAWLGRNLPPTPPSEHRARSGAGGAEGMNWRPYCGLPVLKGARGKMGRALHQGR